MAKIAIIGAGGFVFPLRLVGNILAFPELRASTIALMDIHAGNLERTTKAVQELVARHGFSTRVQSTLAQDMKTLCPNALLLNYANPMAMNCWLLARSGINTILGGWHQPSGVVSRV